MACRTSLPDKALGTYCIMLSSRSLKLHEIRFWFLTVTTDRASDKALAQQVSIDI